jgi:hypothetical protein
MSFKALSALGWRRVRQLRRVQTAKVFPGGTPPSSSSLLIEAAWDFFGCSIKACSMDYWLEFIEDCH